MNICIFGASSDIIDKKYSEAAYNLSGKLAEKGHSLVFGGGGCGVMGACARGFYDNGASVLGVAPKFMEEYNLFSKFCTEFKLTETMAERKTFMENSSDAFIIAPGGIGTYEEFFEVYTLKQLGRHNKAIVIFNPYGYYDKMLEMLHYTVKENFLKDSSLELIKTFSEAEPLIHYLESYEGTDTDVMSVRYAFLDKSEENE